MRVFAISDVHVDHEVNSKWVDSLSTSDFQQDVLILAGDISDSVRRLEHCFTRFARRFAKVLFVPGNHELWVVRDSPLMTSLQKHALVCNLAEQCGISMSPLHIGKLSILPMMSWYDFSFGVPSTHLTNVWMDFRACRWPLGFDENQATSHFLKMNAALSRKGDEFIISFSHFLPRIDVMPTRIPDSTRALYPVFGSARLGEQVRALKSNVHVYGHSHLNRRTVLDGTLYVNNAFAYPQETHISAKALACIYEVQ